ncbi:MAG TPA: sugar ABC transporter substrate-binding protein [Micromonosporaceae bacterium]|nr:sugar ABC transporter substrate-binding protein [Micromonosporaceae bacterium]
MRNRRWRLAAAAAAVVVALPLAACGRSEDGGGDSGGSSGGISEGPAKGEITVWAMGTEGEKLAQFAADFTKDNPEAKVTVTAVPWDAAHQKIAGAIAGRQTPDVSMLGSTWMGEFGKTGALDVVPDGLIDKSTFFEGAWNGNVVNDKAYGVPWYVETRLIFYRKDLAAKAGITQPPTTWEDLKTMAKALKEKAGAKNGLYLQPGETGAWQSFMPFAWQNGATLVDGDKFTLDSPEMVEAMKYYQSYFTEGLSQTDLGPGMTEQEFVAGRIAAFISGPWHIGLVKDKGGPSFADKFDVMQMPKGKAGATSFVGGGNLGVFKDAKNRDAAWKFVAWLSKPETQAKWYGVSTDLPAVKKAWEDPKLTSDPMLATFGKQLEDAKSPPPIPNWEQVAAVIDGELEKVCKSKADPAAAAKTMQQQATGIGTGV